MAKENMELVEIAKSTYLVVKEEDTKVERVSKTLAISCLHWFINICAGGVTEKNGTRRE